MGYFLTEAVGSAGVGNQKSRGELFSAGRRRNLPPSPSKRTETQGFRGVASSTRTPGMRYYGFRYYNPELGRWVNRDPIKDIAFDMVFGMNESVPLDYPSDLDLASGLDVPEGYDPPYVFVLNNPANLVDELGLAPCSGPRSTPISRRRCQTARIRRQCRRDPCGDARCVYFNSCAQIAACENSNGNIGRLSSLPDCPCCESEVPSSWTSDGDSVRYYFHGSAASCRRSPRSGPDDSRQQCCYDRSGSLITHGAQAGTPDLYGGLWAHRLNDVVAFVRCGWSYYNANIRPPNNANSCASNAGDSPASPPGDVLRRLIWRTWWPIIILSH